MADEKAPDSGTGHWVDNTRVMPRDLKLKRAEQRLVVEWRDGHHSDFDAATLRQACPCATCREKREQRQTTALPILEVGAHDEILLSGAELMGQYAIKLIWSDGHDAGMFDYRYLRSLDPR